MKFISSNKSQVEWGGNDDPDILLNKEQIYEIEKAVICSYHTKLYFKDIEGAFDSVSFEIVSD